MITGSKNPPDPPTATLSVIIVISSRYEDPEHVYEAYSHALYSNDIGAEYIYILDGPNDSVEASLLKLQKAGEPILVISLSKRFGEAACLSAGLQHARAARLLILTPYLQIDPVGLQTLVAELNTADLVVAARDRRSDSRWNRLRGWGLRHVGRIAGSRLRDPGCLVRACRRDVLEDVPLHGEQYRFLPLLAERAGYAVREVVLPQAAADRRIRFHHAYSYVSSTLDFIVVAFLLKFTQKPFRLFGTVGLFLIATGTAIGLYLLYERMFQDVSMADRPMLLLSVLLVVLGVQIGAAGLIAEIMVFSQSHKTPSYRIRQIVEHCSDQPPRPSDELE